MATVTAFTSARSKGIEDNTIVNAYLSGDNLILQKNNGNTVNVGSVRGPQGNTGAAGSAFPIVGLAASYDLNTLAASGFYWCSSPVNGNSASPSLIRHFQIASDTAFQIQNAFLTGNNFFYRRKSSGSWSSWETIQAAPLGAKAVKNATQSYSASTWTKLTLDASVYADTYFGNSMLDLTNNRFICRRAGRYFAGCDIQHVTSYGSSYVRQIAIVKGDAAPNGSNELVLKPSPSQSGTWYENCQAPVDLVNGDYITFWFQSGVASNFGAANKSSFWLQQ